ncbi:sigma-54 dependent transcriptional regulator [Leptolyngbya sp. 15MV]|nr:sigma-54 dependent transcriptional regulator [Leptolyngbya sp. 15MV]
MVDAVAAARTTLLMTGESGVGKSVIARAIHDAGPRRSGPFVEISCGSIPETLLESELFGHVKGAFTGAHADKIGRFRAADGGTLFLDEINSASAAMQLKLLRVLQERRFEPVGSTQTIEVDVRVIVASNQPLEALVASGQFRQDLFYRVNVVKIELPPLRERRGDIAALARHFLASHAEELGKQVVGFTPEAIAALERYTYPGNVRELENIVERAVVLCRTPTIGVEELPEHLFAPAAATEPRLTASVEENAWTPMTLEHALREPERRIILSALRANNWNRQRTAEQLGINRTTLYKRMKALEIDGESTEAA